MVFPGQKKPPVIEAGGFFIAYKEAKARKGIHKFFANFIF
jgi:hypothetical protein